MGNRRATAFAREVPTAEELYPDKLNFYILERWTKLQAALDDEAEFLIVAFPEVLGDSYMELVVNLGKIAQSKKGLFIAGPSPLLKETGEVDIGKG